MDFFQNQQEIENIKVEERPVEFKSNKCYNEMNRLLFSQKCIYIYILLIFISIIVFFYSLIAHFFKLGTIINNIYKNKKEFYNSFCVIN
jgi:hypothetical protein